MKQRGLLPSHHHRLIHWHLNGTVHQTEKKSIKEERKLSFCHKINNNKQDYSFQLFQEPN